LIAILGEDACEAFLAADNDADLPVTVQVNTLLTDTDKALTALYADGVRAERHKWLDDCIELRGARGISRLDAFRNGSVYVQDAASRLAVCAADPGPGDIVIDGCAAPGGKSFASAIAMGNSGRIIACDIHESKLPRLVEGAKRLGITIIDSICRDMSALTPAMQSNPQIHISPAQKEVSSPTEFADSNNNTPIASSPSHKCGIDEYIDKADIVFADVPCSGFGAIRKKPEIRYKPGSDISDLPDIQQKILTALSAYVKPGGTLLYSTCTILRRENEDIINEFLRNNDEFSTESFPLPGIGSVKSGMITLWPHIHGTDGFFICKLRRRAAKAQ
jgi:16S rRNA (cytosine967-C5)-methyltransferase